VKVDSTEVVVQVLDLILIEEIIHIEIYFAGLTFKDLKRYDSLDSISSCYSTRLVPFGEGILRLYVNDRGEFLSHCVRPFNLIFARLLHTIASILHEKRGGVNQIFPNFSPI